MKLIDKDAVVTEIERRIYIYKNVRGADRRIDALVSLKNYLNIFEVKEVDLEKEFEWFLNEIEFVHHMRLSGEQIEWVKNIAKHFFELGLSVSNKAQKGERV